MDHKLCNLSFDTEKLERELWKIFWRDRFGFEYRVSKFCEEYGDPIKCKCRCESFLWFGDYLKCSKCGNIFDKNTISGQYFIKSNKGMGKTERFEEDYLEKRQLERETNIKLRIYF